MTGLRNRIPLAALAFLMTAAFLMSGLVPAAADDRATIEACVTTEINRFACIGRIAKPCMTEPGGETTIGMKTCSAREAEAWDALLNAEYKKALANLEGKGADKLRTAQRAWLTVRDNDCAIPFEVYKGGTIAGVIAGGCLLEHTAVRALQLRDLRESSDSH